MAQSERQRAGLAGVRKRARAQGKNPSGAEVLRTYKADRARNAAKPHTPRGNGGGHVSQLGPAPAHPMPATTPRGSAGINPRPMPVSYPSGGGGTPRTVPGESGPLNRRGSVNVKQLAAQAPTVARPLRTSPNGKAPSAISPHPMIPSGGLNRKVTPPGRKPY